MIDTLLPLASSGALSGRALSVSLWGAFRLRVVMAPQLFEALLHAVADQAGTMAADDTARAAWAVVGLWRNVRRRGGRGGMAAGTHARGGAGGGAASVEPSLQHPRPHVPARPAVAQPGAAQQVDGSRLALGACLDRLLQRQVGTPGLLPPRALAMACIAATEGVRAGVLELPDGWLQLAMSSAEAAAAAGNNSTSTAARPRPPGPDAQVGPLPGSFDAPTLLTTLCALRRLRVAHVALHGRRAEAEWHEACGSTCAVALLRRACAMAVPQLQAPQLSALLLAAVSLCGPAVDAARRSGRDDGGEAAAAADALASAAVARVRVLCTQRRAALQADEELASAGSSSYGGSMQRRQRASLPAALLPVHALCLASAVAVLDLAIPRGDAAWLCEQLRGARPHLPEGCHRRAYAAIEHLDAHVSNLG